MTALHQIHDIPPAPARPPGAHKGTFGTVIVVGGSATMPGAPALCAAGALRSGVGLVKVAVPAGIVQTVIAIEPGATAIALGDDADSAVALLDQADPTGRAVLAVGPGWGAAPSRRELLDKLLAGPRVIVLDADGLNALAQCGRPRPPGPPLVITPHPGEFRRLADALGIKADTADPKTRPNAAARLAANHQAVVVLKGQHTVVSDGHRYRVNTTGNPALATAGTGDVLTGVVASLCAAGLAPFEAAVLGAHLHGLAADLWSAEHGSSGLRAQDLSARLPDAFQRHRQAGSV